MYYTILAMAIYCKGQRAPRLKGVNPNPHTTHTTRAERITFCFFLRRSICWRRCSRIQSTTCDRARSSQPQWCSCRTRTTERAQRWLYSTLCIYVYLCVSSTYIHIDYVRQGALLATSMVRMQNTDHKAGSKVVIHIRYIYLHLYPSIHKHKYKYIVIDTYARSSRPQWCSCKTRTT